VKPGRYQGKIAELRAAAGGRCVWCGVPDLPGDLLEFAHLPGKPTGLEGRDRGLPNRYYDVKKNPDSYVLLCREHHTALDGRGTRSARYQDFGTKRLEEVAA